MFLIYHGEVPSYLCEHFFLIRSELSSRSTRSSSNLDFIFPRIKICEIVDFVRFPRVAAEIWGEIANNAIDGNLLDTLVPKWKKLVMN